MREFGPDNTPHDLADNPKRSEFLYSLDAAGRRTSMIEKFWLDADNNVNTPDVPKQNTYTWTYDANGKLLSEVLDSFDDAADRTETFVMDLFGNRRKRTTDKPSTAYVDEVITYLYNADDRITSELLDKQNNGTTDQTTTYAWSGTLQSSKTVVIPSTSTVTQTFSYTLPGMLSRVVTENKNGSNVVTSRTRVDYDYTSTGIRSLSVDWNDANLNNSFATSERTGSVEYLVDSTNHTGYAQTIVETTKNAAGVATKRIVYTYGSDEISQTTYLPPAGGGAGWNAGTTLTFSHDAHTSVRMLTDAAGAIAQVFTYAAYGELIAIHNRIAQSVGTVGAQGLQSQALTSLLYNGESFDSRIGQLYLRARWYDGHRFTTLDPYFGNGSDPLSFNKYGFVHANPVMGIDPTGMSFSVSGFLGGFSARSIIGGITLTSIMGVYASFTIGRRMTRANESFHTAAERLEQKLLASQKSVEGKDEAKRIAAALKQTYINNGRWQYPNFRKDERQKGVYCAEWAQAFLNASRYESKKNEQRFFKITLEAARGPQVPGEDQVVHLWIRIESLNDGSYVYVDDAFWNRLFVHDSRPIPIGYEHDAKKDFIKDHTDFMWNWIDTYSHDGRLITDPRFVGTGQPIDE